VNINDLTQCSRPGADSSWLSGSNCSRNHEVGLNFGLDLTPVDFAGFAKSAIAQPQETAIAEINSEV
jgi:hypothetical protein